MTLLVRGKAQPPAPVHEALYRITQEALNNVVRHAHATTARVELDLAPAEARLMVSDDGCGFDADQLGPASLGLRNMRERAAEAGMALRVETRAEEGTVVRAEWSSATRP